MTLEIIYQDEYLAAINKPPGLLVHRSKIANDAEVFALQTLRNQLNVYVYPIHRLDRKTSGALLFALNEEIHKTMQLAFAEKKIKKTYLAIVRGYTENEGIVNYPLVKENGKFQEAVTHYQTIARTEIELPFGQHPTSRYSLLEVFPETGRKHQIRKHLAHIHHPIIADRPWGDNKQNKLFKEKFGLMTMMLHALELQFNHPITGEQITISAALQSEFKRIMKELSFANTLQL